MLKYLDVSETCPIFVIEMVIISSTKVVKKVINKRTKLTFWSMRTRKTIRVPKARAIQIAMNHNGVTRQIAENYTDSELREVLLHLKLKAGF